MGDLILHLVQEVLRELRITRGVADVGMFWVRDGGFEGNGLVLGQLEVVMG